MELVKPPGVVRVEDLQVFAGMADHHNVQANTGWQGTKPVVQIMAPIILRLIFVGGCLQPST